MPTHGKRTSWLGALPFYRHGVGRTVRVLVFAEGETVTAAEQAGADFAGSADVIKKIEGGWTDFDVSIATPDMMDVWAGLGASSAGRA